MAHLMKSNYYLLHHEHDTSLLPSLPHSIPFPSFPLNSIFHSLPIIPSQLYHLFLMSLSFNTLATFPISLLHFIHYILPQFYPSHSRVSQFFLSLSFFFI
uniref:Uncharacterized protein n=1 Tax=Cacopsylla melanoneura TaxID=428564 RepID=A0A8D8M465_9HEMI